VAQSNENNLYKFYLCGVHPVALFTYNIYPYNIYNIHVISNRNSFYSSVTSLHVSAPTGHLQVKSVSTSIFVFVKTITLHLIHH
jgi:hypothetical protein